MGMTENRMPKISIVILNYNSLALIKSCLQSFEKYPPQVDYEIIIANNDNNYDAFKDFSKRYPEVKFIQNTGNWGFSSGCNLGASIASGEYFLFLNPDTELTATPAIDKMIDVLERNGDIGICSCKLTSLEGEIETDDLLLRWNSPWAYIKLVKKFHNIFYKNKTHQKPSTDGIFYTDFIMGAVLLIGAGDFKKINGWSDDKYWMYFEDNDICNKVSKKLNKKLAKLQYHKILHVGGGASVESDTMKIAMITSRYSYIYHNSYGLSKVAVLFILLSCIVKDLFIPIVKLLLNTLLFNRKKMEKYKFLVVEMFKYYLKSAERRTWDSDKLEYEKK